MSLTKLTCPECSKVLRPKSPVAPGKKIRCPGCETVFVAEDDVDELEEVEDERPRKSKRDGGKTNPAKKGKAPAKQEKPKEKEKPKGGDEDDGAYGVIRDPDIENEDKRPKINYAPDTSLKDLRGPAIEQLTMPTTWLMRAGYLGVVSSIVLFMMVAIPTLLPVTEAPPGPDDGLPQKKEAKKPEPRRFVVTGLDLGYATEKLWIFFVLMIPWLFILCYSGAIVVGAIKAVNLESRIFGIVGSVMAIIPIHILPAYMVMGIMIRVLWLMLFDDDGTDSMIAGPLGGILCLATAGIGAFNLKVLNQEEVIAGFEYVGE